MNNKCQSWVLRVVGIACFATHVFYASTDVFANDPDSDGFSTEYEQQLGTDPSDPTSHPTIADNQYKILGYWPLLKNAEEAQGLGIDGVLKNGARFVRGSVLLDGKDDYISFGNDPLLSITNSISFGMWIKPEGRWGLERIIGKFKTCGNNREYAVFTAQGERLWIFLSDDGSLRKGHTTLQTTDKHVIDRNNWQYLAVTWDSKIGGHDGLTCYMNDEKLPLYAMSCSDMDSINSGSAELTLGTFDVQTIKQGKGKGKGKTKEKEIVQNPFKGRMNQLILCNGCLSELEIKELYHLGQNGDLLSYINMDYDNDGMPDWWERLYFQDISQTSDSDFDNDGLSNIQEYNQNTLPDNQDSDNDGLNDGQEIIYHVDPLNPDTDGDGWQDGYEVGKGTLPDNANSYPADIEGTISYTGRQPGTIRIFATQTSDLWDSQYSATISRPASFVISSLPNQTNYWLKAYRDIDRNAQKESYEAFGQYAGNPILLQSDVSGINIVLTDSDIDLDQLPDWWENTYLAGTSANPEDDADEDGVNNLQEYVAGTDPENADTDRDGWKDSADNSVSRAFIEWAEPGYTLGNDYIYALPEWLIRAYKNGGEWKISEPPPAPVPLIPQTPSSLTLLKTASLVVEDQATQLPEDINIEKPDMEIDNQEIYFGEDSLVMVQEEDGEKLAEIYHAPISKIQYKHIVKKCPIIMPCIERYRNTPSAKKDTIFNPSEWHVPATEPDGVGSLNIEIDRSIVTGDLVMDIKFYDYSGSSLYVDLLSSNYTVVASDVLGNMISGTEQIVSKNYDIPLASYPTAGVIKIRRGTGEITVGEIILYIDQDHDNLDAGQEAFLQTSDLLADSDKDGVNDDVELAQGTDPADINSFWATVSGAVSYSGSKTGNVFIAINTTTNYLPLEHQTNITMAGSYSLSGVPTLTNYYVSSWLDFNKNRSYDLWEPHGDYAGNPYYLSGNASGINVTIIDAQDTDGDGLADAWEQKYFSNPVVAVPTDDSDNDTLNNLAEYYKGTDPTKKDTDNDGISDAGRFMNLKLMPVEMIGTGLKLAIGHPDEFTNRLDVFSSTDLMNKTGWSLESTVDLNAGTNIVEWLQSTPATDRIFFKVFNADYDQDGDGLADGREKLIYVTDVLDWDSDDDGLSDGEEINHSLNPLDAQEDSDSDQIKDAWEVINFGNLNSSPDIIVTQGVTTIQSAINSSSSGDIVLVKSGTYTGTGNKNIDFNGKEVILISENGSDSVTINCQTNGRAFYFDSGEDGSAVISGFRMTGGASDFGGAIYSVTSSPTIRYCTIISNTASCDGGGIYLAGSDSIISNCTIESNMATTNGAGIHLTCKIWLDHMDGYTPVFKSKGSSSLIEKCHIKNNHAGSEGAAVYMSDTFLFYGLSSEDREIGTPKISKCYITGNSANNSSTIQSVGSVDSEIENTAVVKNYTRALANSMADMNVVNCTVADNFCDDGFGAAAFVVHTGTEHGSTTIKNSIVRDNYPEEGQVFAYENNNYCQVDYSAYDTTEYPYLTDYTDYGAGNITSDPKTTADGHLMADSPCLGAGTSSGAPSDDIDGETRSGSIDMGADQFEDKNQDGLGDAWQKKNGLSIVEPSNLDDDEDNDGLTAIEEYEADGNPKQSSPDSDGDGLSDEEERLHRTNENDWDSDDDLVPDGWEIDNGYDANDPSDPVMGNDDDEDDLTNFEEMQLGTNPKVKDSDGDGVEDGDEVTNGSNPSDADDNGDPANCVEIELVIGDHSGSHSERYAMKVGDKVYHVASVFGELATNKYAFVRGKSYPFEVKWIANDSSVECEPRPDYDYQATMDGLGGSSGWLTGTNGYMIHDPDGILGTHSESTNDFAYGKTGTLYVVKVEFRESAENNGFDDTTTPEWLIVPINNAPNTKTVVAEIVPSGIASNVEFEITDTGKVTVSPSIATSDVQTLTITGQSNGITVLNAKMNSSSCGVLNLAVRDKKTIKVAVHFMHDNAGHYTTTSNADAIVESLNNIFSPQANVVFTKHNVDSPTITNDLGSCVEWYPYEPDNEWDDIVAAGDATADVNLYFVWEYEQDGSPETDNTNAGTLDTDCIIEDNRGSRTIEHEVGHALGLEHNTGDSRALMWSTSEGGFKLFKHEVDVINP